MMSSTLPIDSSLSFTTAVPMILLARWPAIAPDAAPMSGAAATCVSSFMSALALGGDAFISVSALGAGAGLLGDMAEGGDAVPAGDAGWAAAGRAKAAAAKARTATWVDDLRIRIPYFVKEGG